MEQLGHYAALRRMAATGRRSFTWMSTVVPRGTNFRVRRVRTGWVPRSRRYALLAGRPMRCAARTSIVLTSIPQPEGTRGDYRFVMSGCPTMFALLRARCVRKRIISSLLQGRVQLVLDWAGGNPPPAPCLLAVACDPSTRCRRRTYGRLRATSSQPRMPARYRTTDRREDHAYVHGGPRAGRTGKA